LFGTHKSFVVVSVYSSLRSIDDVAQFRVNVTDGPNSEQLLYPEKPLDPTAVLSPRPQHADRQARSPFR